MALGSLVARFQTLLALCCLLLLACWDPALGSAVLSNSNSIKNMPGGQGTGYPVSASPDFIAQDTGNKNHQTLDSYQPFSCVDDDDCAFNEFCYGSRGGSAHVCLACRKRRKRCLRDAMCCPGNYCNNGVCVPNDQEPEHVQPGDIDETILESVTHDHGTMDTQPKRTTSPSRVHHLKGREGDVCLRSSDCSEGLCCARHFWSKICKPVLTDGQVCTKHRRKGSHGLEIFQRCDCGEGLACRTQREHAASRTSRLHTCQRH